MWLRQSHEVTYRPSDDVSIAVQPTGGPRLRADHLRNITRNRRLFGDNDYGHGFVPGDVTKTKLSEICCLWGGEYQAAWRRFGHSRR